MSGRTHWTPEAVRDLGVTTDLPTAGSIVGLGRSTVYDLHRQGRLPFPTLTLGHRVVVPVAGILAVLGIEQSEGPVATGPIATNVVQLTGQERGPRDEHSSPATPPCA